MFEVENDSDDSEARDEYGNVIDEDEADITEEELSQWKRAYYLEKFGIDSWDNEFNFPQTLAKVFLWIVKALSY